MLDSAETFSTSRRDAAGMMLTIASALFFELPDWRLSSSARALHRDQRLGTQEPRKSITPEALLSKTGGTVVSVR
jgi:hypothetical protein